jgi:hypothetical protein
MAATLTITGVSATTDYVTIVRTLLDTKTFPITLVNDTPYEIGVDVDMMEQPVYYLRYVNSSNEVLVEQVITDVDSNVTTTLFGSFTTDGTNYVITDGGPETYTLIVAYPPGTPTNIVATAGDATLTATWAPPSGMTSADITKYTVSISPAPLSGASSYDVSGTVTSQPFNNLANGTTYTVSVSAWNTGGQGSVGTASDTPAASGGGGSGIVPCFFGNAPVLTASGYRRMDSLRAGDRVMTPEGAEATIERVKVTQCTAGPFTNPYVIPKGRFGAERRVLISPNHKVVTDNGMEEARHLGLEQEERTGELTYYNLELTDQAHMVVGGVAVESLAPVRRMTMTLEQFKQVITQKYGGINANVLANIQRTCRLLADGRVEVPVLRR